MNKEAQFCECNRCNTRNLSVFKHLSLVELDEIDSLKSCKHFTKGEYLYKENTYSTGIFCVSSGKIKLVNTGDNGKEHILKIVQHGDILGENALFSNHTHKNAAIAIENTTICFIPKEAFLQVLRKSPLMTMDVLDNFANQLENAENKQTDFALKKRKRKIGYDAH